MNVSLFLAMLFIASCRQEHSSSCCKLRNMCSCCGVRQGERRFIAVLEIEIWMLIKASWTLSLTKRSYSVSCFSCQRLINKLEGCVEGRLTRSSVLQYSAIQLCLWKASSYLVCLHTGLGKSLLHGMLSTLFSSSPLLQLSTCSHSHFTRCLTISSPSRCCWLSQTISNLLPGHTCRKKEWGSALALLGARSMCYHGCEVPLS